MVYRDRWFCAHKGCKNLDCDRNTNRSDFNPGTQLVSYMTPAECPHIKQEGKEKSDARKN